MEEAIIKYSNPTIKLPNPFVVMHPLTAMEKLFFAIFGQARNPDLMILQMPTLERTPYRPDWTKTLFKMVFAVYMLVTVVVLVKLLIATMSDTYQHIQIDFFIIGYKFWLTVHCPTPNARRLLACRTIIREVKCPKGQLPVGQYPTMTLARQAQSDIEWKFGLSKLIRNIDQTTTAPPPINLITSWSVYFLELCRAKVHKNPIEAFEQLFFAVFGQTVTEHLQTKYHRQSQWTEALFKIVFGTYMLVSVVVLINLLIAMMTDTYQRIQAQSDIEWKFGLCKLIRNMHRTSTAPSPINLITTWFIYFLELCRKARAKKKPRQTLHQMVNTIQGKHLSPRSKAGAIWLSKIRKDQIVPKEEMPALLMAQMSSPGESQTNYTMQTTPIEHVTDWEHIAKKYRKFMGYEDEIQESENTENI